MSRGRGGSLRPRMSDRPPPPPVSAPKDEAREARPPIAEKPEIQAQIDPKPTREASLRLAFWWLSGLAAFVLFLMFPKVVALVRLDPASGSAMPLIAPPPVAADPVAEGFQEMAHASEDPAAIDRASKLFAEALVKNADDPRAIFGVAWVAHTRKDLATAEKTYLTVMALTDRPERLSEPNVREVAYYARYNLGLLHADAGRYEAAEPLLLAATVTDPGRWEALFHLGRVRLLTGQLEGALSATEESLRLSPDSPVIHAQIEAIRSKMASAQPSAAP